MSRIIVDLNPKTGEMEEYYWEEDRPVPPLVRPKVRPQKRPNGTEPDKDERERRERQ